MANKNEQGVLDNETLIKSEAFIEKYKQTIIIAVVAVIVIVTGFFLYKAYVSAPREEKARRRNLRSTCAKYSRDGPRIHKIKSPFAPLQS